MLHLDTLRAAFASYPLAHADSRKSLDAALLHVAEIAYSQGLTDALLVPDVLTDPIPDLDPPVQARMRGPLAAWPAAVSAPGVSGQDRPRAGGNPEGGDAAAAPDTPMSRLFGCLCAFDAPEDVDL